jgi:hypothetical protein
MSHNPNVANPSRGLPFAFCNQFPIPLDEFSYCAAAVRLSAVLLFSRLVFVENQV